MNEVEKRYDIIVVDRCISVDFEAQAAVRTTPTMGAVGQAGGIAAALAVGNGCPIGGVNTEKLHQELINQGASLSLNDFQSLE